MCVRVYVCVYVVYIYMYIRDNTRALHTYTFEGRRINWRGNIARLRTIMPEIRTRRTDVVYDEVGVCVCVCILIANYVILI